MGCTNISLPYYLAFNLKENKSQPPILEMQNKHLLPVIFFGQFCVNYFKDIVQYKPKTVHPHESRCLT